VLSAKPTTTKYGSRLASIAAVKRCCAPPVWPQVF
jgi:hypothetical protein